MDNSHAMKLATALADNALIEPLGEAVLPDLDAAYELQTAFIDALAAPLGGWKIGATNPKSQSLMGLDRPFYGPMPERFCVTSGASFMLPAGSVGAEIELAFRLSANLPKRQAGYGIDESVNAIGGAYGAIEVIGLRQKWQGVPEGRHAVADLGANCIFAHAASPFENLIPILKNNPSALTARCLVNGEETGKGDATLVLGSPLLALQWLADNGPGLRAGDWISTGTMTGLTPVKQACEIVGDFGGLGQVRLMITA